MKLLIWALINIVWAAQVNAMDCSLTVIDKSKGDYIYTTVELKPVKTENGSHRNRDLPDYFCAEASGFRSCYSTHWRSNSRILSLAYDDVGTSTESDLAIEQNLDLDLSLKQMDAHVKCTYL